MGNFSLAPLVRLTTRHWFRRPNSLLVILHYTMGLSSIWEIVNNIGRPDQYRNIVAIFWFFFNGAVLSRRKACRWDFSEVNIRYFTTLYRCARRVLILRGRVVISEDYFLVDLDRFGRPICDPPWV